MGGDVTVTSEPGEGAVFTLELPMVDAGPVEAAPPASNPPPAMLVVERNPIARGMYKALLTPPFGEVAFAGSLAEAAGLLATGSITHVLADDATLRADVGLSAAVAAIAAKGVAVTLLWAPQPGEQREALAALGARQVLVKPISRAKLVEALAAHVGPAGALECRAA